MVDILCAGQQTEEYFRRFAVFDDNDRYVGLKLGLTADDINPNWSRDALSWGCVFCAVHISSPIRKPDRVRQIAEALAISVVANVFSLPRTCFRCLIMSQLRNAKLFALATFGI
jgi:hypothetical protein